MSTTEQTRSLDRPGPLRTDRRILVVGSEQNEATCALVAAWRSLGLAAANVPAGEALSRMQPGDTLVCRLDVRPTLDGVEPGLLAVLLLERRGLRTVNSVSSLLAAHDKLRTARLLGQVGLPHPRTQAVSSSGQTLELHAPLVVKPRFGSWGADVHRCETEREARDVLEAVAQRPWFVRHGAIVQELLPESRSDLRLIVAGGRVVGAATRTAAEGEWRSNVSLGGSLTATVVDDDAAELAQTAAAVIGADFVGVDLVPQPEGGYVVLELNGAVDFDETYSLGGRSVFAASADALGLSPSRLRAAP